MVYATAVRLIVLESTANGMFVIASEIASSKASNGNASTRTARAAKGRRPGKRRKSGDSHVNAQILSRRISHQDDIRQAQAIAEREISNVRDGCGDCHVRE